jgi:hypothetical protein
MSSALDQDPGPLFYAPKRVRDHRRIQELIEEIQKLIAKPEIRRPSPTTPVDAGVPRSFQPTLMPEAASVPHPGTLVSFSLVVAVAAIAGALGASTFPSTGTMATAAERSNETPIGGNVGYGWSHTSTIGVRKSTRHCIVQVST